jgi:hypothetical protein
MARKPRVEFERALYDVIVQGNHRRDIFRDRSDRVAYLGRIEHYRERYRCIVYAYVLMTSNRRVVPCPLFSQTFFGTTQQHRVSVEVELSSPRSESRA